MLGLVPAGFGRCAVERRAGRGAEGVPRASALRLHTPGPQALQRHLERQHPHGPAGEPGRSGRRSPARRHGTRHRAARERSGHARRAEGRPALRRPGAAHRRRPHVRATARAPSLRRSVQRARRRDGAAAMGASVRAARRDRPGRVPSPRRLPPRRPHRGAEGRQDRRSGQAGRPAPNLRGDATPLGPATWETRVRRAPMGSNGGRNMERIS